MKRKTKFITHAAVIAALYVVLTSLAAMLSLDKGIVQFRIFGSADRVALFDTGRDSGTFYWLFTVKSV